MTQTNSPDGRTEDDAPEWIFATGDGVNGSWTTREMPEVWGAAVTKYRRADLAQPDPLADQRVTALVEAVRHERELVCQDFDMQLAASKAVDEALAAFGTTYKPQGENNEVKGGNDE